MQSLVLWLHRCVHTSLCRPCVVVVNVNACASVVVWGSGVAAPVGQFVLADAAVMPNFDPIGVVLISGALVADAFVGNTQESLFAHGSSLTETIAWSNLVASIIAAAVVIVVDDVQLAITYVCARGQRRSLALPPSRALQRVPGWPPASTFPAELPCCSLYFLAVPVNTWCVVCCSDTLAAPWAMFCMVVMGVFCYFGLSLILTVRRDSQR